MTKENPDSTTKNKEKQQPSHSETSANKEADNNTAGELLDNLPEEQKGEIGSFIKKVGFSSSVWRGNPVAEKITGEHLTQVINHAHEQDKRDREERTSQRRYNLILLFIALAFIGFIIVFLQGNQELLIKIIIALVSFVGGFGLGKSTKNRVGSS